MKVSPAVQFQGVYQFWFKTLNQQGELAKQQGLIDVFTFNGDHFAVTAPEVNTFQAEMKIKQDKFDKALQAQDVPEAQAALSAQETIKQNYVKQVMGTLPVAIEQKYFKTDVPFRPL